MHKHFKAFPWIVSVTTVVSNHPSSAEIIGLLLKPDPTGSDSQNTECRRVITHSVSGVWTHVRIKIKIAKTAVSCTFIIFLFITFIMAACPRVCWLGSMNERDLECHERSCDLAAVSSSSMTPSSRHCTTIASVCLCVCLLIRGPVQINMNLIHTSKAVLRRIKV